MKATAKAHPNIALIKYWGKRDQKFNLPAVGSISITLQEMATVSTVEFQPDLKDDILILNGTKAKQIESKRVSNFLDLIRAEASFDFRAKVNSENNFPTGAGLASSASAFASLAVAGSRAAGLALSKSKLSELARRGSGSAARSIWGGFVEMKIGERSDGSDAVALQLADENYWDVGVVVAITSEKYKNIGSTKAMNDTARTSPFYGQWVFSSQKDLEEMRSAIFSRNFHKVGELSEFSCLKMHAVTLSARPGIIYWNKVTIECIECIRQLRKNNTAVYFTIDAGPQVKALCLSKDKNLVKRTLQKIKGVKNVIINSPGSGAEILNE